MTKAEKSEKPKIVVCITGSIDSEKAICMPNWKESKGKVISSKGSGKETNKAEQLDTLLNQFMKEIDKSHDTEVSDASMTL